MSKDWTPAELAAASSAMEAAGHMSYEAFCESMEQQMAKTELEQFAKIQGKHAFPCPRCGQMTMDEYVTRNALSRYADVQICDACGISEAVRVFTNSEIQLTDWYYFKHKEAFFDDV